MLADIIYVLLFPLLIGVGFGFIVGRIYHRVVKKYGN